MQTDEDDDRLLVMTVMEAARLARTLGGQIAASIDAALNEIADGAAYAQITLIVEDEV